MYKAIESLYIANKESLLNLFSRRTAKPWKRLLRAAVQAASCEVFGSRLDKSLSNLAWPRTWLGTEAGPETS